MTDTFEYSVRPGSTTLSVVAFIGLGSLTALLWQIVPAFFLLFLIPAMIASVWQITKVPTYGIRITPDTWHVMGGYEDLEIPTGQISYLKVVDRADQRRAALMLVDGSEIILAADSLPSPIDLIREATARGIPVREFS